MDASHYIGADLSWAPDGDLATAVATLEGEQRVLRRIITPSGDYVWHPDYGAGLPDKIGRIVSEAEIQALTRSQMGLEQAVQQNPPPKVTAAPIQFGYSVTIQYVDADTGEAASIGFDANSS
jgi:hypothetical protein